MNKFRLAFFAFFSIIVLASSCKSADGLEKIQKSKDFDYKLKMANQFYDQKKYSSANTLYEELLTVYKGTKNFEDLYYKYAFSFYYQKNYLASSYHFKNFTDIFPNSAHNDECEYLNCLCLYHMSPNADLDQTSTAKSITAMQNYVNMHPNSKHVAEANKMIDEARAKIEEKDKNAADLYFKISEYKSATSSFAGLIKKFPDSKNSDYYQLMILKSTYNYARLSIPAKQNERFNIALGNYTEFITNYPNSAYKTEADKIKNTIFALQKEKEIK